MAHVHLLSSAAGEGPGRPYPFDEVNRMRESAAHDRFGVHTVVDRPESADLILFVENCHTVQHYQEVRTHPVYQRHTDRCLLHSCHDHPLPLLPGVYASLRRSDYHPERTRTGGYLRAFAHAFVQYDPDATPGRYLYSFIGKTSTHPVRDALMGLQDDEAFLFDTDPFWPYGDLPAAKREMLETQYRAVSQESIFVLCPRGIGTSSMRLFETLRLGRVPVIIADDWVAPVGPDWDACSIRIAEADVPRLPELLRARRAEAPALAAAARQTWCDWFARDVAFHRTVEWCLQVQPASRGWSWDTLPHLLSPTHLKSVWRYAGPRRSVA